MCEMAILQQLKQKKSKLHALYCILAEKSIRGVSGVMKQDGEKVESIQPYKGN